MAECPKCGRKKDIVAISSDYVVIGCPEHREYDETLDKMPIYCPLCGRISKIIEQNGRTQKAKCPKCGIMTLEWHDEGWMLYANYPE